MVIAEGIRVRILPSTEERSSVVAKPKSTQLSLRQPKGLRFEMLIPEKWLDSDRHNCFKTSRKIDLRSRAPRIEVFHDPSFLMEAEEVAKLRAPNRIELVSAPRKMNMTDGRKAWIIDVVRKNPHVFSNNGRENYTVETHCNLNDTDGSIWTIIFSTPSASIHRKLRPLFERKMLPSFRPVKTKL